MLIKKSLILIAVIIIFVTGLFAGKLLTTLGNTDSPSAPGSTKSYTLKDIYDRLVNGAVGTETTFTEPTDPPGTRTMHTLNEIMTKAPAEDNNNGARTAEVLIEKTFWGLNAGAGEWGPQTGTAAEGDNVSGAEGNKTFPIPDGFYSNKTATANDADLVAGNIEDGVEILGVTGSLAGPVEDNTNGAKKAEVLTNKTFWGLNAGAGQWGLQTGTAAVGNNVSGVEGSKTFPIPNAFYSGKSATANDADLLAGNIKDGVEILGVTGDYTGAACITCSGTMNGTRWCDNGDGTVTDMLGFNGVGKGLVWLQKADWGGTKNWRSHWTDCSFPDFKCYDDAHKRASSLTPDSTDANLSDGSVLGDWRLPTKSELYALTHGTEPVSSGNMRAFTGLQSYYFYYYWSSTTCQFSQFSVSDAWCVDQANGNLSAQYKGNSHYVWPVRAGQ
jgi:hypothetical protein